MLRKRAGTAALILLAAALGAACLGGMLIPALAHDNPRSPVPAAPTGVVAEATGDSVVVTWDDPGDDSITGYQITRQWYYRNTLLANTTFSVAGSSRSHTDRGVRPGHTYSYRVRATSDAGTSEASKAATVTASRKAPGNQPTPRPENQKPGSDPIARDSHKAKLSGISISPGSLSPAFDPGHQSYTVNLGTSTNATSVSVTLSAAPGSTAHGGGTHTLSTTSGTTVIDVEARKGDDSQGYSIQVNRQTTPGSPTITSTIATTSSINLRWNPPAYTGVTPITTYNIRYKATLWTDYPWMETNSHAPQTYEYIANLSSGITYSLEVQARNSFGTSDWSSTRTVRTQRPNNSPRFGSNSYTRTVNENTAAGQNIGSPITASDSDGDSLSYSISGDDAASFTMTSGGQLQTNGALDFETKNNHSFTIRASDGHGGSDTATVTVAVEDLQEPGSVAISPATAIIHQELTATLQDDDERTSQDWQWSRADTLTGSWTDIEGADGSTYTPGAGDRGKYLRARAEYDDIDPDQSAERAVGPVRDPTLLSLTVSPKDIHGFHPARFNYAVGVASTVTQVTVTAQSSNPSAGVAYSRSDASPGPPGHQVSLNTGLNPFTITVTDGDLERAYTIDIGRGDTRQYGWKAEDDLNTLQAAENLSPRGIWSDETTLWVADDTAGELMAYSLSDTTRSDGSDIRLDSGNPTPRGAWSDGTTIWVADASQAVLLGYPLSGSGSPTEFTLHGANTDPWGIWSNGHTLWAVDRTENKLFAYDLSTRARLAQRDISLAAGNQHPTGAWSDGLTLWVTDDQDGKLYAYNLSDGSPDSAKDFGTLRPAGNTRPQGLWGDGRTIWVSDAGEQKIYSYNLPISDNANLSSITVSATTFSGDSLSTRMTIRSTDPADVVTVSAATQHPRATVVIAPADAHPRDGHQVQLDGNGGTITITVTAQDGDTRQTYTVQILVPAGPPTITGVTPGNGHLDIEWSHPEETGGAEETHIFFYFLRHIESDATDKETDENWTELSAWNYRTSTPLSYTLEELQNGTSYDIQMRAFTASRFGAWSESETGTPTATQPPAFVEESPTTRTVQENTPANRNIGAPVRATDPDPQDQDLLYSLAGTDADHFSVNASSGQLRTKTSRGLDHEGKNTYEVEVRVSDQRDATGATDTEPDTSITVTINVGNSDEGGMVELPDQGKNPKATVSITVQNPTDPDGPVSDIGWQWSSSTAQESSFTNIAGADGNTYTPTVDLIDSYLRVTATYTDPEFGSGKRVSATSESKIGEPPNLAPVFPQDSATLTIEENTPEGTAIGEPFTAEDPDNQDITYSLEGTDAGSFNIDEDTGQLRAGASLDFETKAQLSVTIVATDDFTALPLSDRMTLTVTLTNVEEEGSITVSPTEPQINVAITATLTDPDGSISNVVWQWDQREATAGSSWERISGATSSSYTPTAELTNSYLRVTATYRDALGPGKTAFREMAAGVTNTKPAFGTNPSSLSVAENNTEGANVGSPINASDANGDAVYFSLRNTTTGSGHAASFRVNSVGQVTVAPGVRLDHETQESYAVTVQISDHKGSFGEPDSVTDASLSITINVTDADDPGEVRFDKDFAVIGTAVQAVLSDQDGTTSNESWQWSRATTPQGSFSNIPDANGQSYAPRSADLNMYLRATVSYTDADHGSGKTAQGQHPLPVENEITFTQEEYQNFHTFENPVEDALVFGNPELRDALLFTNPQHRDDEKRGVTYTLLQVGDDHQKYSVDSKTGTITVNDAGSLDHNENGNNEDDSITVRVTDDYGADDTAVAKIEIKDLIEDRDSFLFTVGGDTITWTRVEETHFLLARDQANKRRPEFELNAQILPCVQGHRREGWQINDQYRVDMWLDGDTLNYRDPERDQQWTPHGHHHQRQPAPPGHQPQVRVVPHRHLERRRRDLRPRHRPEAHQGLQPGRPGHHLHPGHREGHTRQPGPLPVRVGGAGHLGRRHPRVGVLRAGHHRNRAARRRLQAERLQPRPGNENRPPHRGVRPEPPLGHAGMAGGTGGLDEPARLQQPVLRQEQG